jgi:hypothetical protein
MSDGTAGSVEVPWARLVEEVMTGLREWHAAHPGATCAELEAAVEERLGVLRARMLAEALLTVAAAETEARACARCAAPLAVRDTPTRTRRSRGDQRLRLTRPYRTGTACGRGLFPPG